MKKLINRPQDVVAEMVEGLAAAFGGLRRLPGHAVLLRAVPLRRGQVALVSGGGSGHEPAHAGYVGAGMLSAAVCGDVFTSPAPDSILAAVREASGPAGTLLIVKNYTGDRLNFGLAAEMARAEGTPVEVVLVADDVALGDAGSRRGLAGTVLVHKAAGAAAEAGAPLAEVAAVARRVAADVRTMGVALTPCTVPAAGRPSFALGEGEVELGLGIHGEPGVRRAAIQSADALTDQLLDTILAGARRPRVALMVNGLGGTPAMELAVVARRAVASLEGRGSLVERVYCGTFLSALEMAGVSLSVVGVDDRLLALLDAPTDAPAWPNAVKPRRRVSEEAGPTDPRGALTRPVRTADGAALRDAVSRVCAALTAEEDRLTRLDQAVGDGDLGASLQRGASAVSDALAGYPLDDAGAALRAMGETVQRAVGGTSGPLYAAFLIRAGARLRATTPEAIAAAFRAGCDAVAELGGAAAGDRTMLDALSPAAEAFASAVGRGSPVVAALAEAAEAARRGAAATADMAPRKGRSSYLGPRALGHPDPGAEAVAVWLAALAGA